MSRDPGNWCSLIHPCLRGKTLANSLKLSMLAIHFDWLLSSQTLVWRVFRVSFKIHAQDLLFDSSKFLRFWSKIFQIGVKIRRIFLERPLDLSLLFIRTWSDIKYRLDSSAFHWALNQIKCRKAIQLSPGLKEYLQTCKCQLIADAHTESRKIQNILCWFWKFQGIPWFRSIRLKWTFLQIRSQKLIRLGQSKFDRYQNLFAQIHIG